MFSFPSSQSPCQTLNCMVTSHFSPHFVVNNMFPSYFFFLSGLGISPRWLVSKNFAQLLQPSLTFFLLLKYIKLVPVLGSLYLPFPLPETLPSHFFLATSSQLRLSITSSQRPSMLILPTHTLHILALLPPPLDATPLLPS